MINKLSTTIKVTIFLLLVNSNNPVVWIPVQNDPNDQEVLYHYKLGEVDLSFGVSKLSEILASGTYEEVYSSGKFKQ